MQCRSNLQLLNQPLTGFCSLPHCSSDPSAKALLTGWPFGSVTVPVHDGSNGSGFRFGRFLRGKAFSVSLYCLTEGHGSSFSLWSLKYGSDGSGSALVRAARLQNEVGTKDFFRGTNFRTKSAPKFSPIFLSLYFVGLKKSARFPPNFPAENQKNIHRRASAGRREKVLVPGIMVPTALVSGSFSVPAQPRAK